MIKQQIEFDPATAQPSPAPLRPVTFDLARLAEAMIEFGMLRDRDWKGDLAKTIRFGLYEYLKQRGLAGSEFYRDQKMDYLQIIIADDIEHGLNLRNDHGYEGAPAWWRLYGRPEAPRRWVGHASDNCVPPIGAFAMVCGSRPHILKLKTWGLRLQHEFGSGVTQDILAVFYQALDAIHGMTPAWVADRIEDWYDGQQEEDEPDGLTREKFEKNVPAFARSFEYNVERLRDYAKNPDKRGGYEWRCCLVLQTALQLAETLEALSEDQARRRALEPAYEHYQTHTGLFDDCVPPLIVCWSGKVGSDLCWRVYDDHLETIRGNSHSDVCWLQGFDIEKPGGENVPGTVQYALRAMERHVTFLKPLLNMVRVLSYASPKLSDPIKKDDVSWSSGLNRIVNTARNIQREINNSTNDVRTTV